MNKFWIRLNGMSMFPMLNEADEILIVELSHDELKLGDIVLFLDKDSRELTLHRLIGFPFTTKGDYSLLFEENSIESFIGKAIGFRRRGTFRTIPLAVQPFLILSQLRMKGVWLRRLSLIGLFIFAKVFEVCSDKAKLDHNKEPLLDDL